MKYNIANLYIANRQRAEAGGGGSAELETRVQALETADGYNTTETLIGKCGTDDLYRKIYTVASPSETSGFNVVDDTLLPSTLGKVLRLSGTYKIDGSIRTIPIRSDGESIFLDIDTEAGLRVYVSAGIYTISDIEIVVEYTKAAPVQSTRRTTKKGGK